MQHDDELEADERIVENERKRHDDEFEAKDRIAEDERKRQDDGLAAWIAAEELGLQALYERNKEADMEELLIELKHDVYTFRWDKEGSLELWRNNYYEIVAYVDGEGE
ncbi:hypothetical protein F2Q69_00010034 [Brassica cretica]|uniref:Uncharacterized protein n=1 Tax=Brassica cretica TaxID=69181 RepID=A0A8S9NW53_BRACR|nr:hypothetical protein F2Q69_00010034 [Brassica cretica]